LKVDAFPIASDVPGARNDGDGIGKCLNLHRNSRGGVGGARRMRAHTREQWWL
jgi:hypothetical protein